MKPGESGAGRTITTVSSREVYRNPWMRVREDEILRSNGEKGIFGVTEKDDAAIIIPTTANAVQTFFIIPPDSLASVRPFPQKADWDLPDI